MDLYLILSGLMALAVSGLPGLLARKDSRLPERLASGAMLAGAALGLCGCGLHWAGICGGEVTLPWSVPWGHFALAVDHISALFLIPILLVPALGSIYGLAYYPQKKHPATAPRLRLFYGLLAASMGLVVIARDSLLFLMAWEIMALSAFFLVTTEDDDLSACRAGWRYLVATHLGTLCLFAMFLLLARATGSSSLDPAAAGSVAPATAVAIGVLALAGFGMKAGLMPLHVWLPGAHATAPTHVSAVMSGVMIKMGVYGIVRITALLPPLPVTLSGAVLALGVISGLLGVVFAIAQHDLKRLLAYHSIENIGIIVMGLGLAMLGRSLGREDWVVLGLAGGLLHVWNHALFKPLLFFAAGSAIHATHTREIDRMGGLARRMPWTGGLFIMGAVAICGLPPLNGFISELLIYLGLLRTAGAGPGASCIGAAFAVPALAMIGGLAVACFVKVCGVVFLGEPRTLQAREVQESPAAMRTPMLVLAGGCLLIGLLPLLVSPALDAAARAWTGASALPSLRSLVPLGWIGFFCTTLAGVGVGGTALLWLRMRRGEFQATGTWDCGYAAPSERMQYTASSFAQMLVGLFAWLLRPRFHERRVRGLFPPPARFESHVDDVVLEGAILPLFSACERLLTRLRVLQQGRIQLYILYLLIAAVLLLGLVTWA